MEELAWPRRELLFPASSSRNKPFFPSTPSSLPLALHSNPFLRLSLPQVSPVLDSGDFRTDKGPTRKEESSAAEQACQRSVGQKGDAFAIGMVAGTPLVVHVHPLTAIGRSLQDAYFAGDRSGERFEDSLFNT